MHSFNLRIGEAEVKSYRLEGQPGLHSKPLTQTKQASKDNDSQKKQRSKSLSRSVGSGISGMIYNR